MRFIFLLLLSIGLFSHALCQQRATIQGLIKSEEGPLPGATVHVEGTEKGAVANLDGKFSLSLEAPGLVKLQIRSIGYKPQRRELKFQAGDTLEINVALKPNNLGLDEVVVTGTMSPTFVTASPIKVEVITSRYLDLFIPAASSSIVEAVTLVNGVQEVVECGVCFTNSISINGLPGPYTAVLMDGMPMYGNLASVYGLNGVPSMIIDRFEVIKGPSSTLYGSEAVAGVINIITKDPADQPLLAVDVMGTSMGEAFGNLALAPKIGKANGYIGLSYGRINLFQDRNEDGFSDIVNMDRYALFSKWNIDRKSGKKFSIAAKYYYEDRRNGVEGYLKNGNYREIRGSSSLYGESIYTNRAELFGTYQLALSENMRVDYSLSSHLQDSYYGADHYVAEQKIAFANFIWDKEIQNHSLLLGVTSRYQYYDDNTVATAVSDRQFIPGVFLQDEWDLSSRFTLLSGARLDHYTKHGPIFSPRLNIKYKPGQWTTLRGNFGTGFRIVNLFTEDHAFVTGQRTVEIVEELKPERSYNGALNLNHVYTLGNSQGTIDVDAYYTYFTNKIIPDYDDPSKIVYANTNGYAQSRGVGVNISQEFAFPLSLNLGVNMQRATQTEENEEGEMESRNIEFAPRWSGVFTASYHWKKVDITFGYNMRLTGNMALPEVYDLDEKGKPLADPRPLNSTSFSLHDLQLSKKISPAWSVYAGMQNILDYVQPYSPLVGYNDPDAPTGFSPYFDTAYSFAPIHGREIYLGLKWNLWKK